MTESHGNLGDSKHMLLSEDTVSKGKFTCPSEKDKTSEMGKQMNVFQGFGLEEGFDYKREAQRKFSGDGAVLFPHQGDRHWLFSAPCPHAGSHS